MLKATCTCASRCNFRCVECVVGCPCAPGTVSAARDAAHTRVRHLQIDELISVSEEQSAAWSTTRPAPRDVTTDLLQLVELKVWHPLLRGLPATDRQNVARSSCVDESTRNGTPGPWRQLGLFSVEACLKRQNWCRGSIGVSWTAQSAILQGRHWHGCTLLLHKQMVPHALNPDLPPRLPHVACCWRGAAAATAPTCRLHRARRCPYQCLLRCTTGAMGAKFA
jgi:hypothetical protein